MDSGIRGLGQLGQLGQLAHLRQLDQLGQLEPPWSRQTVLLGFEKTSFEKAQGAILKNISFGEGRGVVLKTVRPVLKGSL